MSENEEKRSVLMDLEKPLAKEVVSNFLPRKDYVGKEYKAEIKGLATGQFKHDVLLLKVADAEYQTDLSKPNKNWLIDTFGPVPKNWVNRGIIFTCVPIVFEDRRTKEQKEGFELKMKLP